ncbi:hypothetical protein P20311_0900 [Pseudoalteromonas sp. BSi20311]|jgi:hypothetical protein|uniref:hypothetical protein n=1 Tax=unclassified Pseudoalteromonas TaxID=194690 RepID=UPI0002319729|nr:MULTISPECIES: hypothetical protein [unclassified Pseudoalteromonas]GAA63123.1 hypothetical protein P20311_0900 [Pseudoalteromonas sp. BSi20311]GAA73092.1 hypothetical protein P20439_3208 [Pseudoalteromonas sp. BSi20439]HCP98692.1 hypothetical protein [Pseudoalteromonas sp.]|tara:strand:- start:83 stop:1096 length:1014 start_codon:yes stop_codon:yes gene_type:complete
MSDNNIKIESLLGDGQKWQHSYEQPISYAPLVQLANKNWIVPQHFLRYKHTLASVNEVLNDISFSNHFSVLAAEKNSDIYLQVAVLSPDNYRADNKAKKLLFGRRWPVEQNLPTSELIQTAFLALKVAREHEVRELFQLQHQEATSTPFNNHHDLPVMAQNPDLVTSGSVETTSLATIITRLVFADAPVTLMSHQSIATGEQLYTVKLNCEDCQLSEFNHTQLSFLASDSSPNSFLHSFINALVNTSNEYVNEHFKYQGFARFSKHVRAERVGELSVSMRSPSSVSLCSMGKQEANQLNFEIDSARAPQGCGQAIGGFLAAHGIEQPENAHLYPHYL